MCNSLPLGSYWFYVGLFIATTHLIAISLTLHFTGVLSVSCPSVNGRICNGPDKGVCTKDRVCNCTNPFFSGDACQHTLSPGYIASSGAVCTGQGFVGAPLATLADIPAACREQTPQLSNGFRRIGGWDTDECFAETQARMQRLIGDSPLLTSEDIFSLPLCTCFPPASGTACSELTCPFDTTLETCSGHGNISVTYTTNSTRNGLGCQCRAQIVNLMSTALSYTEPGWLKLKTSDRLFKFQKRLCGRLVQHPTKPDLKTVLTHDYTEAKTQYACHCDALHFGEACEFGVCPERDGLICSNNGHPSIGIGYERNTTRNDPGCQPVCSSGQFLCNGDCRSSNKLCSVKPTCSNASHPIRCRDGSCAARPRPLANTYDYSFGFDEAALTTPKKRCFPSTYANSSTFLTSLDYSQLLAGCAGDMAQVNFTNAEWTFIPLGKMWFDSSLLSVVVEFTKTPNQSITLRYRNQAFTLTEGLDHRPVSALFTESYEDKLARLLEFEQEPVTVITTGGDLEVDLYPAPFMHDASTNLPTGWETIYLKSQLTTRIVPVSLSVSRMYVHDQGQWFIANITSNRALIPGGAIISIAECINSLVNCAWNVETRLSYDGTRKLCSSRVSSEDLSCVPPALLPSYIRFDTMVTGTVADPSLGTFDWVSQGPWFLSSNNGPVSDTDFSFDGSWLFIENPNQASLRRLEFVQLRDIIVPNACPPSTINATTLNERWFQESGRRVTDLLPGSSYAVGKILHPTTGAKLVRGRVVAENTLVVRGYEDLVQVLSLKEITSAEFERGLPYEDVHIFPALCPDGTPATLKSVDFSGITVKCECTVIGSGREMFCDCKDHLFGEYTCTCPVTGACKCNDNGGKDWLLDVELALKEEQAKEDLGFCYYYDAVQQIVRGTSFRINITADENGIVDIVRPDHTALLLEVHVPCPGTNDTLFGRSTLYSDSYEEISVIAGTNCSLRPVFANAFEDRFDAWQLLTQPNSSVEFVFAPGGIPVTNVTISASTNEQDANNVLWNDFSHWRSDPEDPMPMITIGFNQTTMIVGIYAVLETVGIYIPEANTTIPVEVMVQGSTDAGVNWHLLGVFNSSVYQGEEDMFFPLHDHELTHVRFVSEHPLGISTMIALTNQYCTHPNITLYSSNDGVTSLEVLALGELMNRGLNDSLPCIGVDNCMVGFNMFLGPNDTCADELYLSSFLPALWYDKVLEYTKEQVFAINFGINTTGANITHGAINSSVHWWSLMGEEEQIGVLNPLFFDNFFLSQDNLTAYFYANQSNFSVNANGTFEQFAFRTLVDRGIACPTGMHVSACGPSNRLTPAPLPGVNCSLSAYKQRVMDDLKNRTDHFITRSSFVEDFLSTEGSFYIKQTYQFQRNSLRISRGPCGDCDGKFKCTTGECVSNLRDCPAIRYNCPGNGCTRISVNEKKYTCACKPGFGGKDCASQQCVAGDMNTGLVNPYLWCACGQFPPLKAKPPYVNNGRALTTEQLRRSLNYDVIAPGDFQNYAFFTTFAPFGDAVLRSFQFAGRTVYTTCGFYKRGPFGEPISFMDANIFDPETLQIIGKVEFNTPNSMNGQPNAKMTYPDYNDMYTYDEIRWRCPHGGCVSNEEECYNDKLSNPPCGQNGKCRVDGTCDCFTGSKTLAYTNEYTNKSMIPYNADNPTEWGVIQVPLPNSLHCAARDCSDGSCAIPFGCYPGSKEAGFRDAQVVCSKESGQFGWCGVDDAACRRGVVTAPLPCSGLGIPRQRDYFPYEWYCECGDLKTKLAKLSDSTNSSKFREITELRKNGWGGYACQDYYCQDNPAKMAWSYRDERTRLPYVDHEQYTLRGKFVGGTCGAPIGPNPDDVVQWSSCCPDVPHTAWGFARCNKILCRIGNTPQCVVAEDCTGRERTPMVYSCHGKGRALADGTCECQQNKETGQGYGPDESGVGCYRKIQCSMARNNVACNHALKDFRYLTEYPKVEYWEAQIPTLLLREGINPTPENLVKRLVPGVDDMKEMSLMSGEQTALEVRAAELGLNACIYIHNETDTNCSAPIGMVAYCGREAIVGFYGKAVNSPHQIEPNETTGPALLFDRKYQQIATGVPPPILGIDYIQLRTGDTVLLRFAKPVTISVLKLYGISLNSTNANDTAEVAFYSNETGTEVCGNLAFPAQVNRYIWGGRQNAHYCERVWREVEYNRLSTEFNQFCGSAEFSQECIAWKKTKCATTPNGQIQTLDAFQQYPGCPASAVCCEPLTPPRVPTNSLQLRVVSGTLGLQELAVIGTTGVVDGIPTPLAKELSWLSFGTMDIPVQCTEYTNFYRLLGPNLQYHVLQSFNSTYPIERSGLGFADAMAECKDAGSLLAEARGIPSITNYARFFGEKCFGEKTVVMERVCNQIKRNGVFVTECSDVARSVYASTKGIKCETVSVCTIVQSFTGPVQSCSQVQQCKEAYGLPSTRKCLVSARNRVETKFPVTTQFIRPSCTSFGSYICSNGKATCGDLATGTDFVASSDVDGSMWKTQWNSTIKSWNTVVLAWWRNQQLQRAMIPVISNPLIEPPISDDYIPTSDERALVKQIGPMLKYGSRRVIVDEDNKGFLGQPVGTAMTVNWPFASFNPGSYPNDGIGTGDYWVGGSTCRVSFYGEQNCGNYYYTGGSGDGQCARHWFATPADNYAVFGKELVDEPMWTCASRDKTTCSELGSPISEFTSLAIEGDCFVVIQHKQGNDPVIKHAFQGPSEDWYKETGWPANANKRRDYGCWPQCYRTVQLANYQCPHGVIPENVHENIVNGRPTKISVKIFPKFSAYKVRTNLRVERKQQNYGGDDFVLGWETHPFMCARVAIGFLDGFYAPAISKDTTTMSKIATQNQFFMDEKTYAYTGAAPYLFSYASIDRLYRQGIMPTEITSCESMGRPVVNSHTCPIEQPPGLWEWDQRHYNPAKVDFEVAVTAMKQNSSVLSETARPQLHVHVNSSNFGQLRFEKLWNLVGYTDANKYKAFARIVSTLNATRDYDVRLFLDNCVAVTVNPDDVNVPFSLQPTLCEPRPEHLALCMRDWIKFSSLPGVLGQYCGSSCKLGSFPQPGRTAYDENQLADPNRYPKEHKIYQAFLTGTLEDLYNAGEIDAAGVWHFLRYTLNQSLIGNFPEAREWIRDSRSTRPGRTSPSQVEDPRQWLDFDWQSTWPVDCGVKYSKETGIGRPQRAVDSKYCDPDHRQFENVSYVPETEFPLDLLPLQEGVSPFGVRRCSQQIDPTLYGVSNADGTISPTNRDFVVLEEIPGQHVILRATKNGLNSWHNTGKSDHRYIMKNDTTFYGTYYCNPACPAASIWVHTLSPFYLTNNRIYLGTSTTFNLTTQEASVVNSSISNWAIYRTIGFDFHNLTRGTVVKLGIVLAQDSQTIAECRKPLTDEAKQIPEPPASIQLPSAQNECIFEFDPDDDTKIPGTCHCADISWGGASCDSPAGISLQKGKDVCFGWGRPGYMARVDGEIVPVDDDGVWFLGEKAGCVCLDPGAIIRGKFNPETRFGQQSIFLSQKVQGAQTFLDYTPSGKKTLSYSEAQTICATESTDIPSYSTSTELTEFVAISKNGNGSSMFVDLTRDQETGSIRWGDQGGLTMVHCTNATACGSVVMDLCVNTTSVLCRAVHYNNLLFNTSGTVLTDGRRSTTLAMSTTPILFSPLYNSTVERMIVDIVYPVLQSTPPTLVYLPGPTACDRNDQAPTITGVFRIVYICPAVGPFQVTHPFSTTVQEVYAYLESETTRLYSYHS